MAIHNIYVTVDCEINTFREKLKAALTRLAWDYKMESDNFFRFKLIAKNLYGSQTTGVLSSDELKEHGLSNMQAISAQLSSSFMSGLNAVTNSFSLFKRTVSASEKLMKGIIESTSQSDTFYPELLLMPQEGRTELIFSNKTWESKNIFLILTYLVLKNDLQKAAGLNFEGYDYQVKSAQKKVETTTPAQADKPKSVPKAAKPSDNLKALVTELKINISENKIQDCFKKLEDIFQAIQSDLHDEFLILKSDFNRMKQSIIAGIISFEEAELKRNQINHRFLQLIDLLEEDPAMTKQY